MAPLGTTNRLPMRIVGISPLWTAAYAEFREIPKMRAASVTVMVLRSF